MSNRNESLEVVTVRIPQWLIDWLDKRATREGEPRSIIIRRIIREAWEVGK